MKIIVFLLTTAILQVSASTYGQNVTIRHNNADLAKVIRELRKQTGYDFVYSDKMMESAKPVSINLNNVPFEQALEQCFKNQPLTFTIADKIVTVKEKEEPSFLDNIIARFTDIDVRGRVVDEQGSPLPNASIQVKGKAKVYNSDTKGEFVIANVPDDGVLMIRYVGYKQLEISLKDAVMPLEIKLNVTTGQLEEVKIEYTTGYQTLNLERATGAVVQLDNEILNRKVSTNILDRITEITSGLNYKPNPNVTGQKLLIRGISTITANTLPLIVVDGFPYTNNGTESEILRFLNNINPNDVESITILKDAAAASIWGAQAGAGVIVINTKKGKFNQKAEINLISNMTVGEREDIKSLPLISPSDIVDFELGAYGRGFYNSRINNTTTFPAIPLLIEMMNKQKNGSLSDADTKATISEMRKNDVRSDIKEHFQQLSINQQYAFNISGGVKDYKYYFSTGYDKNKGNRRRNESNRYTLRFDNSYKPTENLEIGTYLIHLQTKEKSNGMSLLNSFSQYTDLVDVDGKALAVPNSYRLNFVDNPPNSNYLDWHYRPYQELFINDDKNSQFNSRFGGNIRFKFLKAFSLEAKGQYEKGQSQVKNHRPLESFFTRNLINQYLYADASNTLRYPIPTGGILDLQNIEHTSWNIRAQLNYDKKWKEHEIAAILGSEIREIDNSRMTERKYGYNSEINSINQVDYINMYFINPARTSQVVIPYADQISGKISRFRSFYSNALYTLFGKYNLSVSARLDGANLFGVKTNQRQNPFWSSGFGWPISKEKFYNWNWLPVLKMRSSFGYNGNIKEGATAYPTIVYTPPSSLTGTINARVSTPPNPSLKWEKVKIFNIGLDFASKNSRISGSIELYKKSGLDLISTTIADPTSGIPSFLGNSASIKGKGYDIVLNTRNIDKKLLWETNILFSHTSDKVFESYINPQVNAALSGEAIPGKPLLSVVSYRWAGLNPLNGDPMGYIGESIVPFSTIINENLIKTDDLVYHGSSSPTFFGSFRNTFRYHNFSISANVTFKLGYYFRSSSINYDNLYNVSNGHADYDLRWRQSGDELFTNVPSLPLGINSGRDTFYRNSEILVEKGDHIRLQDVRANFSLNKTTLRKLLISNINFYVYANNLGIIWKANDKGIDPEFQTLRTPRAVGFGFNTTF